MTEQVSDKTFCGENLLLGRSHYPGLNELRAIAVLCVIPGHVEQMKQLRKLPYGHWFPIPGKLGVVLFFALSGFLITTLLLKEKHQQQRVSLKKFYFKRALRIWPLYFSILAISILLMNRMPILQIPHESVTFHRNLTLENRLLLLFILPNYLNFVIPYAGHLWSIGIEEQFYLVQPFVVKVIEHISIMAGIMLVVVFLEEAWNRGIDPSEIKQRVGPSTVYFGCIAIGCLGSILCYRQPKFVRMVIHHNAIQIGALLAFVYLLIKIKITNNEQVVDYRFYALIFTIVIINAATNPKSICSVNNAAMDYVGRISYGIYMFHPMGVGIAIAVTSQVSLISGNRVALDIMVYCLTLCLTLGVSALSYRYFEGYFLRLKDRPGVQTE